MEHPALQTGGTAVVTGAALGIGRAAAERLAVRGMKVCLVDLASDDLEHAGAVVGRAADCATDVMVAAVDVADAAAMNDLAERVSERLGPVRFLMNNAVTRAGAGPGNGLWTDLAEWRRAIDVNLLGVVHGVRAFVPRMIEGGEPACVVNVGSKQGITNPPGNSVYNLCKAAVKSYTESLEHTLRTTDGARVTAHLLIPGWTTTGKREHKKGAWLPAQVVDWMFAAVDRGDFYILCPDDEVTLDMDRKRILWAAGDIVDNRPPLSRWHGGYNDSFEAFEP